MIYDGNEDTGREIYTTGYESKNLGTRYDDESRLETRTEMMNVDERSMEYEDEDWERDNDKDSSRLGAGIRKRNERSVGFEHANCK